MKTKESKGITLISLMITIVVLSIIAGISINSGGNLIEKTKLESLRTNMLLIQAKAKQYAEEANFKLGFSPDASKLERVREEVYGAAFLEKSSGISANENIPVSECYIVTQKTLELWNLKDIKLQEEEYYLIKFDETNVTVEVYNTIGFNEKYSLTDIDAIEI